MSELEVRHVVTKYKSVIDVVSAPCVLQNGSFRFDRLESLLREVREFAEGFCLPSQFPFLQFNELHVRTK